MRLKRWLFPLLYLVIFLALLICAITSYKEKKSCAIVVSFQSKKESSKKVDTNSQATLKSYIIDVINNGSDRLETKAGAMLEGYATPQDAPDVAEYVLHLMGKKEEINKNGRTIYEGNCAGCHGQRGDGINGAFPRLDRGQLLGGGGF